MTSTPPSRLRWFLYAAVALVFAGGVWWFGFHAEVPKRESMFGSKKGRNTTPAPVRAVAAKKQDLSVHLKAIGTVVPLNIVTVRSRVEGQLMRVAFKEGEQVEKGKILAEIDPLPYQIKLSQAEGQLRQNESTLRTARSDLERFIQLNGQGLVTQQQLEAQKALVTEREGSLAADQAMVDDARRQLAYTKIEAPISGRLGLRQVDAGNLVRPNDAGGLVVITQIKPVTVAFTIPEIDLQKVVEPMRSGEVLPVEAWDRGEQIILASGALKTVDNQIDLATGTLKLKAEFANEDEKLFPNQFVNVRMRVRTLKDVIVVPSAAVQFGSRGTYVYLVNEQSQATVRNVVLGPGEGGMQSVTSGLEVGEKVVLEGMDRLREGRVVYAVPEDGGKMPADVGGKKGGGDGSKKGGGGEGGGKKRKQSS
jgi:membrane fusion protein, multidrug efflux system